MLFAVALSIVILAAGIVTAMKGRWGWLFFGLLLAGLPWLGTALQSAEPDSYWARRQAARAATKKA